MNQMLGLSLVALIGAVLGCSTSSEPENETPYELRVQAFVDATLDVESRDTYSEVLRLNRGVSPDESKIQQDLDRMDQRLDTADFKLPALLWMLYDYSDSGLLSEQIVDNAKDTLLGFKYWPDELMTEAEPNDTDNMVYWTENHFILFSTGAYLAGQLYPDEVFASSGETGAEKMVTFRPRIMRWLKLRYEAGFSEWLSNVYYDEDIPGLMALVEFADDQELRELATMVLDLIYADMALNQFQGNFGSTHGRTYEHKMTGTRDATGSSMKLLFDLNEVSPANMGASVLALSTRYQLPQVIHEMARDLDRPVYENRQRMSIAIEDASDWGLDYSVLEDGMTFLTLEAYTHPLTVGLFVEMLNAYKWWYHSDFEVFLPYQPILEDPVARQGIAMAYEKDITRNMRPEVNLYTYRTPDFMLSAAQDWRKGYGGDQQSLWQATLGMDAVVFTTHPANEDSDGPTPRYWTGYGTMPRVAQSENVVVSLYQVIDEDPKLYVPDQPRYTHAFFPRAQFDETSKEGGWFFGRKGDAYVALWSSDQNANWVANNNSDAADFGDYEIIADGAKAIWLCELGRAADYVDYQSFKTSIVEASLSADAEALTVDYESPSQGRLVMSWDGPVTRDGAPLDLSDFPRYENPYATTAFPADVVSFEHAGESLILDFGERRREFSSLLR